MGGVLSYVSDSFHFQVIHLFIFINSFNVQSNQSRQKVLDIEKTNLNASDSVNLGVADDSALIPVQTFSGSCFCNSNYPPSIAIWAPIPGPPENFKGSDYLQMSQQPGHAGMHICKNPLFSVDPPPLFPVDPPPVLELVGGQTKLLPVKDLYLHCTLYDSTGTQQIDTSSFSLTGHTLVAPRNFKNKEGHYSYHLNFPDLTLSTSAPFVFGYFRLKFELVEKNAGQCGEVLDPVFSNLFIAFCKELFRGKMESTRLTRLLAAQGADVKLYTHSLPIIRVS